MQTVLFLDQIMVHPIRSKTSPESVHLLRVKTMPEVGVEFLLAIEEVKYIEKPIVFIDFHIFNVYSFSKIESSSGVLKDDWRIIRNIALDSIRPIIFYKCFSEARNRRSRPIWKESVI